MTPQRWQRLQQLFERALPLDQDAQFRMLAEECADDAALREQVLELLRTPNNTEVEQRVEEAIGGMLHTADLATGQLVGRFRIAHLLGRGGMGAVYLAERADEQYQQQVALKVVSRGLLQGEVPLRFRAERQILARLNHPNIARLLDGGHTSDGTPYIVMEYIEGLRIDHHCEQHRLSTLARLQLIQQVCAAIHYAHQHLIVHRDLKPSNILVTKDGTPKLLDFGIAKLLDPEQAADPLSPVTRVRDRVLTPEHASPEQLRGEPVGTVSDIYSLGVLMYELLTGRRPYDFANRSLYEMERAICEQSHLSPSALVQTSARGTGSLHLRALARELAGDLDNIVLKAMHPNPEHRYGSAAALSQDIQNYIERKPVQARPDTLLYRTRKFIRRNPFGVASAASVTLLIVALLAFHTVRITAARDNAERERQTAARVSEFMISAFKLANPAELPGKEVTARDVLDAAEKYVDAGLADEPIVRLASLRTIGETYIGMGLLERARALLLKTVEDSRARQPQISQLDLARALVALGNAEMSMDHLDDAERYLSEALSIRAAQNQMQAGEGVSLLTYIAANQRKQQRYAESLRTSRRAEEIAEGLSPPDPKLLGQVYLGYGNSHLAAGDFRKAEAYARRSLPLLEGVVHDGFDLYANSLETLAAALGRQFRSAEAARVYRELLDRQIQRYGKNHYVIGRAWNNYSLALMTEGDFRAAEAALRESLRIAQLSPEANRVSMGVVYYNLGTLHHANGELPKAMPALNASIEMWRATEGKYPAALVTTLIEKSATLRDLGRILEALGAFNEAERIASEKLEPEDRRHSFVLKERGALDLARKDFSGAMRDLHKAKELLTKQDEFERLADACIYLGEAALQSGLLDRARAEFSEALATRRKIFPADHWSIADARSRLGNVLYLGGDRSQGIAMMTQALTDLRAVRIAGDMMTQLAEQRLREASALNAAAIREEL